MKILTPEWITAISTFILMCATIALVFAAFGALQEWKLEKRYDAFNEYQKVLQMKRDAATEALYAALTLRDSKPEDKQNLEYLNLYKINLREKHRKFVSMSQEVERSIFIFYLNKPTIKAIENMRQREIEFNKILLPLQNIKNENEINYKQIEEKSDELEKSIDNVIYESAKSIKSNETIKLP